MRIAMRQEVPRKWVALGQRFEPDPSRAGYYQGRVARYRALLGALTKWSASS